MVKSLRAASVKLVLWALAAGALHAQTDIDRERRLADLERKVHQLDPTFAPATGPIDARLAELERKVDSLLDRNRARVPPQNPAPLETVSVSGDYQQSGGGETRLPVA